MTLLGDKQLQISTDPKRARKIEPTQPLADNPWMEDYTHKGTETSGVADHGESGSRMIVKEAIPVQKAEGKEAGAAQAEKAAEAAHVAGSAVVTGAVAAVLAFVAIPVSVGLGIAWGVKTLARRVRDK